MLDVQNIHPLTDFVRNTKEHIKRLKSTKNPEVLTVNGHAEIVVQDAASYQSMVARLEKAELLLSLRKAIKSIDDGEGIPLEELEIELNGRYGS